jgi:hypothetical protein
MLPLDYLDLFGAITVTVLAFQVAVATTAVATVVVVAAAVVAAVAATITAVVAAASVVRPNFANAIITFAQM